MKIINYYFSTFQNLVDFPRNFLVCLFATLYFEYLLLVEKTFLDNKIENNWFSTQVEKIFRTKKNGINSQFYSLRL
jgi:hypothetical protein